MDEDTDFDIPDESCERTDLQHSIDQIMGTDHEEQQKKSALFILNLKEVRGLSESAVSHVVKEAQKVFRHTIGQMRAGVYEHIANSNIDPNDITDLNEFFNSVEQPFKGLHSNYLQEKFYREKFGCIVSYSINASNFP